MDFSHSARAEDYRARVRAFVDDRILPLEARRLSAAQAGGRTTDWHCWSIDPEIEELKAAARAAGLWNLFLPDPELGAGLSNVDYAPVAEEMGRSAVAPEVFNCNAPDSGNMEVLWKYGSADQKSIWLEPLLAGRIRSAFCMTEPDVASSDATNMRATIVRDGNQVVLNGRKWWSTGIGHPDCRLLVFMGVSEPDAPERHKRHSMVLVSRDTPGVTIERMLPVFGEYDEPYGHGQVLFDDVRVPAGNVILGFGAGFTIAQGRLGPGRIHHCMRCIGAAERALELLVERATTRVAFGQKLIDLGGNRERLADLRVAIDQARLLTLYAAWKLDHGGAMAALTEISAIKVVAPNVLQRVVDEAIQIFGGAGVAGDLPLVSMFATARVLRIADGPDSVHRAVIAKAELARHAKHVRRD